MMRRDSSTAGFTLLELMVALIAGLIAITSVYTISNASTQNFHEQQRVAQAQMATRMALEQIRLDVARAGFLGTANSRNERTCLPMPDGNHFGAVEVRDGMDTGNLPNAGTNGVEADRLRLVGNFATSSRYVVDSAIGTQLRVDTSTQGFRDSFGVVGDDYDTDTFADVFRAGRYLHIEDPDGDHFFVRITGTNAAAQTINFTPGLGSGSGNCVSGALRQAFVSPLMRVEYALVNPGDLTTNLQNVYGDAAQQALDQARGTVPAVLVRREVSFDVGAAPVRNTERVVLDYLANFDVDLMVDVNLVPGSPPVIQRSDDGDAEDRSVNNPDQVRSVLVNLSSRSADQDESFPYVARAPGAPLTRYQVNGGRPGAARVRSARAEIFLPNVLR